ncbi:hypothetical protein DNH61_06065 [Paenibacillus sambharensis]|uniref:Uncharacterized protein n=1 Tax=Paenibacillus sambharensis TaxID=1803190 RepID=A0A2W1LFD1_9BACL|nr:hypothetical protein [Paenibacillus sambharensis]PZD96760.1 hypothetical protein DNH61_06065 [Paenibacillus sambharensis]
MQQKLAMGSVIAACLILCSGMLGMGVLYWAMFSTINLFVNPIGAVLIVTLLIIGIRYIKRAEEGREVYLLGLQYYLIVALMSISNDIYRGMIAALRDKPLFLGFSDMPIMPDELYDYVSVYLIFPFPVPHVQWKLLFLLSVAALLAAGGWFVKTILRIRRSTYGCSSQ